MTMESNKSNQNTTDSATSKNGIIEIFLDKHFTFRYNVIKCQPEFCLSGKDKYLPVDKYVLNSLKRDLDSNGITTSSDNIRSIIESSFSKKINPVELYFKNLPVYDQNSDSDYIKELAETIEVKNPDVFNQYLRKWLVAVVANALTETGCQNHTCLVLTGSQGKFKTTWLDLLCPRDLQPYHFTGKLNLQSKDTSSLIAEMFLINIDDQLRQINKKDENELKNLITAPSIKYRRPYDIYIAEYPHTASFMASVNGNDFLTDPTGSRRFLPFEVIEIDIERAKGISIDLVYSQSYYYYKSDFRYWFIDEEIDVLHKGNQAFQVISIEEQLLSEYFKVPENRGKATHDLQPALILDYLQRFSKLPLNQKKLGEALTRKGFKKWQKSIGLDGTKWVYSVIQKEMIEVDNENRSDNSETINDDDNSETLNDEVDLPF